MNLTTSGKIHPALSYRLAVSDKTIKATFTLKLGAMTMPIPIQVTNPFYQGRPGK